MDAVLIHNIGRLVTPHVDAADDLTRPVFALENAAVWIENGRFKDIGLSFDLLKRVPASVPRHDANARLMLPGFVDCHSHPVFVGNRAHEFFLRNRGADYQEILAAGGGIHATAARVAAASVSQIVTESLPRLESSLAGGVTTIECKSGYGLNWAGEEKLLVALRELSKICPQHIVRTLLIHAVPQEWRERRAEFLETVIDEMIPETRERALAERVDVFCEEGAFTVDEARSILAAGRACGLDMTIHANQFGHSGGALLAAELGTRSADHLEYLNESEMRSLAAANVVAVALPACVYFMNTIPYPPLRQMIAAGLRVAIATDMNPGTAMTESIPFCMTTAAIYGKLSAAELLWAVTYDAARALGREGEAGVIESGRPADFALWGVPDLESLVYYMGQCTADEVWIGGELVFEHASLLRRY
ncbi:MAG: imidazolonepropionase [bacterium]|nr:imidazolonepropionase [bacterium]